MNDNSNNIAVIDLDGTLLTVNSWHYFLRFLIKKALRHNLLQASWLAMLALLRKAKIISHSTIKYRYMLAAKRLLNDSDIEAFADDMSRYLNPDVVKLIADKRANGSTILLATAAAGEYAVAISRKANIDNIIATPPAEHGKTYTQTAGNRKADLVADFAASRDATVTLIATDINPKTKTTADKPLIDRFPHAMVILIEKGRLQTWREAPAM